MTTRTLFVHAILYVSLLVSRSFCSLPVGDSNVTESVLINGQYVINMSEKMKSPLLNLLGKAFQGIEQTVNELNAKTISENKILENIKNASDSIKELNEKIVIQAADICNLHPCNEWSIWSKCDAKKKGTFGTQRRYRKCGYSSAICSRKNETKRIEEDYKLCEYSVSCLPDYNLTEDGFCIKLYTEKTSWHAANQKCSDDGGHLVSIVSAEKSSVVEAIFKEAGVNDVWIDGTRTLGNDEWLFVKNSTYRNWHLSQPDNKDYLTCINIYEKNGVWLWFDDPCSHNYSFMCEY